jgi:hypothetical protein
MNPKSVFLSLLFTVVSYLSVFAGNIDITITPANSSPCSGDYITCNIKIVESTATDFQHTGCFKILLSAGLEFDMSTKPNSSLPPKTDLYINSDDFTDSRAYYFYITVGSSHQYKDSITISNLKIKIDPLSNGAQTIAVSGTSVSTISPNKLFTTPSDSSSTVNIKQPLLTLALNDDAATVHYCENKLISFIATDANSSGCSNYTLEFRGKTVSGSDIVLGTYALAGSSTSISTNKIDRNINNVYVIAKYTDGSYGVESGILSVGSDESNLVRLNAPPVFPFKIDSTEISINAGSLYISQVMNISGSWQTVLVPNNQVVYSNYKLTDGDYHTETRTRTVQRCEIIWVPVYIFFGFILVPHERCYSVEESYNVTVANSIPEQTLRQDNIYQFTFSGPGINRQANYLAENCTFNSYAPSLLSNCGPADFNSIYFNPQATAVNLDGDNYIYAVTKQFYSNINDYCSASDTLKIKVITDHIYISEPLCASDTTKKRIRVDISKDQNLYIPSSATYSRFVVSNGLKELATLTPEDPYSNPLYFDIYLSDTTFQPKPGYTKKLYLNCVFTFPFYDASGGSVPQEIIAYSKPITIYTPVADADFLNLSHNICPSIDSVSLISNYKIENVSGYGISSSINGSEWYFKPSVADKYKDSNNNVFLTLNYYDGHCYSSTVDSININRTYGVDSTGFLQNFATYYCHNDGKVILTPTNTVDTLYTENYFKKIADNSVYQKSDDKVWYFDPTKVTYPQSKVGDTLFNIYYNYYDKKGCPWTKKYLITIFDTIRPNLECLNVCNGETTIFKNKSQVYGFSKDSTIKWDFGDASYAYLDSVTHFYSKPEKYPLKMTVTSTKGCTSVLDSAIIYGDQTKIDFGVTNHVSNAGNDYAITFHNKTKAADYNPVIKYQWDFDDGLTSPPIFLDDFVYAYPEANLYHVKLITTMSNGCVESDTIPIPIFPYVNVTDQTPHIYDFEKGTQGWLSSKDFDRGQNSTWRYGALSSMTDSVHSSINLGWATSLEYAEQADSVPQVSWIESPCFNIDSLKYPMLTMDMFESIEKGLDGATVQYTIDDGVVWNTLGKLNPDIAWYDCEPIQSRPASTKDTAQISDESFGWSKNLKKWQNVRYPLEGIIETMLTRNHPFPCVRFRVKYTSNGSNDPQSKFTGFAFDNFNVTWRKRVLLAEQFTNTIDDASGEQDEFRWLDTFLKVYRDGAVAINYHPWINNTTDSLYDINPSDISARASEYGILFRPKTVLDGFYESEPPAKALINHYASSLTLQDPGFDIHNVNMQLVNGSLAISAGILKLKEQLTPIEGTLKGAHYSQDCVVRIAIVQKEMTVNNINYNNVLIELLPNGEGNTVATIPESASVGNDTRISGAWTPQITTVDKKFRLIIFVQGMAGLARVQQVWYKDIPDALVPKVTKAPSIKSENTKSSVAAKVYPTPANDLLFVQFDEKMPVRTKWQIINMAGVVTLDGQLEEDCRLFSINVSHLADGVYLLKTTDAVTGQVNIYKVLVQKDR